MWHEAVIAEVQGKQSCRTAEDRVGAPLIAGRNQDRTLRWGTLIDGANVRGFDKRDIGRNHERLFNSSGFANPNCHLNCVGFAEIRIIANYAESPVSGAFASEPAPLDPRDLM